MVDIKVRVRDGVRGGREQFSWSSIKEQDFKDRECYLGGTTQVGQMGKFGKYYKHDWYARTRDSADHIDSERQSVQAYEDELMQEALGLKPKKLLLQKKQLSEAEVKEYLKKDDEKREDQKGRTQMGAQKKVVTNEYGEQVATSNEDFIAEVARDAPIKGLGFASHRDAKLERIKALTFGTTATLDGAKNPGLLKYEVKSEVKSEIKGEIKGEPSSSSGSASGAVKEEAGLKEEKVEVKQEQAGKRKREDETEAEKKQRKKEKKLKKAEKKLKKKEKKALKKEKKAAKEADKLAESAAAAKKALAEARQARSPSSDSSDS
eukprot:TRINITY_DN12226_c0_g5_i1.p1 TRINITY_DN12226_c0_g5~~TRINITY_DN12226_c0_g5_i1.p1  ORF type:complete len:348 (-),score=87.34 TRINITY_DN12226_c0_g5_i1:52-1011(-)